MKFLQTLLIILVIYVSIRLLWKAFGKQILKWLGMKALQRVQKSFNDRMGGNSHPEEPAPPTTGKKSTIDTNKFREKKKVGEYVDFEEID